VQREQARLLARVADLRARAERAEFALRAKHEANAELVERVRALEREADDALQMLSALVWQHPKHRAIVSRAALVESPRYLRRDELPGGDVRFVAEAR
jgi:hypothetical protein